MRNGGSIPAIAPGDGHADSAQRLHAEKQAKQLSLIIIYSNRPTPFTTILSSPLLRFNLKLLPHHKLCPFWNDTVFFSPILLLLFLHYLWPCSVRLTEHINRFNNNVFLHVVCVPGHVIGPLNLWFDLDAGESSVCTKCHRLSMGQCDNMRKCTNRASTMATRLAAGSHFSAFSISRPYSITLDDIVDLAHCLMYVCECVQVPLHEHCES